MLLDLDVITKKGSQHARLFARRTSLSNNNLTILAVLLDSLSNNLNFGFTDTNVYENETDQEMETWAWSKVDQLFALYQWIPLPLKGCSASFIMEPFMSIDWCMPVLMAGDKLSATLQLRCWCGQLIVLWSLFFLMNILAAVADARQAIHQHMFWMAFAFNKNQYRLMDLLMFCMTPTSCEMYQDCVCSHLVYLCMSSKYRPISEQFLCSSFL